MGFGSRWPVSPILIFILTACESQSGSGTSTTPTPSPIATAPPNLTHGTTSSTYPKGSTIPANSPSVSAGADVQIQYPDEEWHDFDQHMVERLKKIRELIARGNKCEAAFYGESVKYFTLDRSQYVPAALDGYLPKFVTCVGDITVSPDTVNEVSGCALVYFNSGTGGYSHYFNQYTGIILSHHACRSGGFSDLMQKTEDYWPDAWPGSTVEQSIFTPKGKKWQFVLIYAANSNYVKLFKEARERGRIFDELKTREKHKNRK